MTRYTPLGAILTASLFSMGAWAQSTVLEEITVTAQKREQLAKDVGIAITTFSAKQMDALGFESSTDNAVIYDYFNRKNLIPLGLTKNGSD